jgi:predicted phosphohydrolase
MKIYAISDLHLSFSLNKPMHIFGDNWTNHYMKIKVDWYQRVKSDDLVIVAGDISWAMRMDEARVDLEWIDALPGKKILIKGNHDYWWQSMAKMQGNHPNISFILNNYYADNGIAICGSRGWILPGSDGFLDEDLKVYQREVQRLERSLRLAREDESVKEIVVAFHYPPLTINSPENDFTALLQEFDVKHVVYGHLHDSESWNQAIRGEFNGIHYHLVSCDFTNFKLIEIPVGQHDQAE